MRSFFGLGLKGHSYLVADGTIDQTDSSQIIGYYFIGATPAVIPTYLKLTGFIAPPPTRSALLDDKSMMSRDWQKWFYGFVKSVQETQVLVYKQNVAPTIPVGYNFAIWQDTVNANKAYFIYRRGESDQVKVELTT